MSTVDVDADSDRERFFVVVEDVDDVCVGIAVIKRGGVRSLKLLVAVTAATELLVTLVIIVGGRMLILMSGADGVAMRCVM